MKPTILSRVALVVLCSLICFAPLARGSINSWAMTVLQTGVILSWIMLLCDGLLTGRRLLTKNSMNLPIALFIGLTCLSLAASDYGARAFWGVQTLMTFIFTFYAVQLSVRTRGEQRGVIYTIIGTALFLSVFGLLKRFGHNPFSFWEYEGLKYSTAWLSSTYGNHNHLAGFLEMSLPFLLILFFTRRRSPGSIFFLGYLAMILLTVQALTLSRGGWIATIGSLLFFITAVSLTGRNANRKVMFGLVISAIAVSVLVLASAPVVERLSSLTEGDPSVSMEGRIKAWAGTVEMIKDHLWLGTGPGTYAAAFQVYQPPGVGVTYNYAHNDYLQLVAEFGIITVPVLMLSVFMFYKRVRQQLGHYSRQKKGIALAGASATVAIAIHSVSDFNLHMPGNAFLFTVAVGLICSDRKRRISKV